jgi:hypothetical protein
MPTAVRAMAMLAGLKRWRGKFMRNYSISVLFVK